MRSAVYAVEAEIEATHWWFTERRRLFARIVRSQVLSRDARVLDVGTSTGTNLRMLHELGFSNVEGLDSSAEAVRWCAEKGLGRVIQGDVCALPFEDGRFDFVIASDVLEHVDDDVGALCEICRVLRPGGKVLLTVPAFRSLWGLQDDVSEHKRRYRSRELLARVARAGLIARRHFYFNYLLFVPIYLARQLLRRTHARVRSENELNPPWLNRLLQQVFRFDVWTAPHVHAPFGVSCLVLADRPEAIAEASQPLPRRR